MEAMPRIIRATIETSSVVALRQATRVATWTLNKKQVRPSSEGFHQVALLVSGGMGGTLGLATLIWELPLSTTLMLRSIADIARSEGHSLRSPETLTSCLEVFAMEGGGKPPRTVASLLGRSTCARQGCFRSHRCARGCAGSQGSSNSIHSTHKCRSCSLWPHPFTASCCQNGSVDRCSRRDGREFTFIRHFQNMARDILSSGDSKRSMEQKR